MPLWVTRNAYFVILREYMMLGSKKGRNSVQECEAYINQIRVPFPGSTTSYALAEDRGYINYKFDFSYALGKDQAPVPVISKVGVWDENEQPLMPSYTLGKDQAPGPVISKVGVWVKSTRRLTRGRRIQFGVKYIFA